MVTGLQDFSLLLQLVYCCSSARGPLRIYVGTFLRGLTLGLFLLFSRDGCWSVDLCAGNRSCEGSIVGCSASGKQVS